MANKGEYKDPIQEQLLKDASGDQSTETIEKMTSSEVDKYLGTVDEEAEDVPEEKKNDEVKRMPQSSPAEIRIAANAQYENSDQEFLEKSFAGEDFSELEQEDQKEQLGGKTQGEKFMGDLQQEQKWLESQFDAVENPNESAAKAEGFVKGAKEFFDPTKIIPAGKAAVKGVGKAVEDLANGVYDLTDAAENFFAGVGLGDGKWLDGDHKFNWVTPPENAADHIVFSTARYLLPFGPVSKGISALGLAGKAASTANVVGNAAYIGLTMDPDDKRMADYLEAVPALAPFIPDMLVSKPDDTKLERRMKNAAEALGFGAALEGVALPLLRGIGKTYKGRKGFEAAKKEAERLHAEAIKPQVVAGEVEPKIALPKQEFTTKIEKEIADAGKYFEEPIINEMQLAEATMSKNPEEVMKAFDLLENPAFKKLHDDFKGGVVSFEEASAKAKEILKDKNATEKLLGRKARTPITGEEFVALSMLHENSANKLIASIPKTLEFTTQAEKVRFITSFAEFRLMSEKMLGGSSEAGRVLRYRQEVWGAQTSTAKKFGYLDEYIKLGGMDIDNAARYIKAALDSGITIPELSRAMATKGKLSRLSDVAYSLFVNGALYNTTTFMVNGLGHVGTAAFHIGETTLGALIPGSGIYVRELPAIFHGYASALSDAFTVAGKVFTKGAPPPGYGDKFQIRQSAFDAIGDDIGGLLGQVTKTVGATIEVPTRAMTTVDTFSKIVQQRARVHQYAARQAINSGAKGKELRSMYDTIIRNTPDSLEMASKRFADAQTFTRVDYDGMAFGAAGQAAKSISQQFPMGRVFVPFTQTMTNIADYTLRRTPFAVLSPKIRADLATRGAGRAEAIAKMALGSGIMAMGAYWSATGRIRTKNSDYSGERALETGADFDAIKVNDQWIPIGKLAPIANILFMGAEIAKVQTHFDEDENSKVTDLALAMAAVVADKLTPEFLTENMKDFLTGLADFESGKVGLPNLASGAAKIAETSLPYRWVFKNYGDAADPVRRDVNVDPDLNGLDAAMKETWNRFLESSGMGKNLPVQKNIWGEPINMPPGFMNDTISAFFSGKSDDKMNYYDKELRRLGLDDHTFPALLAPEEMALRIRMPDKSINVGSAGGKMVTSKMTPKQYSQFIDFMNEPTRTGKTMRGMVEEIIDGDLSDEAKKYRIKETIENFKGVARAKMLKQEEGMIEKLERVGRDRKDALKGIQ